nr:hypothetical protein [Corynebacterium diphtheriae]
MDEETHSTNPPVDPDPETTRALTHAAETIDLPRTEVMREIQEQSEEATTPRRSHGALSFGGRVRPSTSILIICLLGFLALGSMTLSGGENNKAGWLAPTQAPISTAPATPMRTESSIPSESVEPSMPSMPSSSAESTMPVPSSSPSSTPSETTLETPTTTDEPTVESSSSPSASESTTAP